MGPEQNRKKKKTQHFQSHAEMKSTLTRLVCSSVTRWPAEPGGPVLPGRPGNPGTPSVPGGPCQIKT